MDLTELQRHWDQFGREDPLWAILTVPGKENRQWDPGDFFQTGVQEISEALGHVRSHGLDLRRRTALDFGCGVGRLTQALCHHFDRVWGVDIAPSMIAKAKAFNRFGERCIYAVNARDDLSGFENGSFDFVYSNITLQHMQPRFSLAYIREFLRVLSPGGVALFQLPAAPNAQRRAPVRGEAGCAPAPAGALLSKLAGLFRGWAAGPSAVRQSLPGGAFRAEISAGASSLTVPAGSRLSVEAVVRNRGAVSWPSLGRAGRACQVHLGNHWLNGSGKVILFDDARACLPHDVGPGDTARVTIELSAPNRPGTYVLELDMVQEGVAWFKDKGSRSTVV
ncbi:MAG: methyltransferase domain-containing protein [Bryobacterales bacterium]|nr:methyltransferase domain-containing protein [Bryobacterales bacterium]